LNGGGILIFKKGVKAVSDVKMGDVQDGWIGCWGKKWFWYVFPRQDYSFDLSSNITSNFTTNSWCFPISNLAHLFLWTH
jgi:hypothetical protein